MLKNICRLESIVEERVGHFLCDNDTPLHIVKEMLFQFQKYVGMLEDSSKKSQEESKNIEDKSEDQPQVNE